MVAVSHAPYMACMQTQSNIIKAFDERDETEQTKIQFLKKQFPLAAEACSLSLKGKSLPFTLFQCWLWGFFLGGGELELSGICIQ